jgi:hypothetical protein
VDDVYAPAVDVAIMIKMAEQLQSECFGAKGGRRGGKWVGKVCVFLDD